LLVSQGKDEAVGPLGTSAGVVTYFLWRSVYFTKLLSFRNRMLLGVNWAFTFFFGRDTSRSR
jgi:NADH:ubiquinone reductase (non-electrogenic)